jgi:hypothetical protein
MIKKIIFISILADILILALLYYIFFKPTNYREEKINGIKSVFPQWKSEIYNYPPWKGRTYKSLFSRFGFYWTSQTDFEKFFSELGIKMKNAPYKAELPLYERGVFYYQKKGESGFEFVFLFRNGKNIYWTTLTGSIFSSKDKGILRKFFENLEIEGKKVSPDFRDKLEKVFDDLPISKIKRAESIFALIFLILIGSQLFILALLSFMGRCPKNIEEDVIVCSSNASVETRNALQVQVQPACICLKHGFLLVYIGGKKTMEIPIDEIQWDLKKKRGRYENKIFKIEELNDWRIYLPIREI